MSVICCTPALAHARGIAHASSTYPCLHPCSPGAEVLAYCPVLLSRCRPMYDLRSRSQATSSKGTKGAAVLEQRATPSRQGALRKERALADSAPSLAQKRQVRACRRWHSLQHNPGSHPSLT